VHPAAAYEADDALARRAVKGRHVVDIVDLVGVGVRVRVRVRVGVRVRFRVRVSVRVG